MGWDVWGWVRWDVWDRWDVCLAVQTRVKDAAKTLEDRSTSCSGGGNLRWGAMTRARSLYTCSSATLVLDPTRAPGRVSFLCRALTLALYAAYT